MAKTISFCQGKGSLAHNNREFTPKNVDTTKTKDNITFVKIPIAEAYDNCFAEAVERYNAKQKRADRKIKNGYFDYAFSHEHCNNVITAPDKRKSFYENVVQIGCMGDTGVGTVDGKLAIECLTEYMENFQKRNPNFYVFNAVLHTDEKTPHLHIDYIPIGHYKRGVDTQNGIAQALKEMGYGEGENAINRWKAAEVKILTEICNRHGIEISEPKKGRGYTFTVEEYKKHKDTINALEQRKGELSSNLNRLSQINNAAKSRINEAKAEIEKAKKEAERVKREAQKIREESEFRARVARLNSNMLHQMATLNDEINRKERSKFEADLSKLKTELDSLVQMKQRFMDFVREEIPKIKSETKCNAFENQIKANMFVFDNTESIEEYVERITSKGKQKEKERSM